MNHNETTHSNTPLLEVSGLGITLNTHRGPAQAVCDVGFTLARGETLGLIGESGSTMILSTSPGGLSEMCITAKTLHLGVALVTAFQVARLVVVVLFSLPIWRLMETIVRRVQARGR